MEIIIEQGNEFNYKIGKVDGEDIFINEYNQAALRLEEIVAATINYEKSIENNQKDSKANESDYLNNIIAFTGERGQGKSSAMHSFTQDLLDYKKKKESHIEYQEKTKTATFLKLDTIDPSTFEDMHNVLEVVIARMYNNLENEYSEGKDEKFKSRAKECKIFDSFQKVYELLSFIRNPKKLDGLENDYEGSLQKIARIGDSTNLKKEMQKLVKNYLELFLKDSENRFLIVPIDDLDINIEYAYKISEQIRKYLMIPSVVIIMAVKVEQLKQCIETVYRKQLEELIKAGERITKEEPINMAAKYVEKLIPDGRKISLPEIRAISQSGKDAVKIVFLGKEVDETITEEKYKKKVNLLKDYKSNIGNSELGIEKTLLAYIYDKTGIVFVKPEITVHPIVPNTLRELVNLLSVLGKMGDYKDEDEIKKLEKEGNPLTEEEKEKIKLIRFQNIKLFEDYFMHTWVPTNLDDGHVRTINELWNKSTFEKHQFICIKMMDMLETLVCYSVDKTAIKDETNTKAKIKLIDKSVDELKSTFSNQNNNCLSYSVGDVVSLLDVLSARYIDKQIANFVFAVKTLYTITMHKIVNAEQINAGEEPNDIYKFIGGDLWGHTKRNVIRGEYGRGQFECDPKEVISGLPDGNLLTEKAKELYKDIQYMTFFCNYPNADSKREYGNVIYEDEFWSNNGQKKKEVNFAIDNIFISPLDIKYTYNKSGLQNKSISCSDEFLSDIEGIIDLKLNKKIAVNYELNEFLKQYCIKTRHSKRLKSYQASAFDYAEHFIKMVHDSLLKIDYIQYFQEDYYILSKSKEVQEENCKTKQENRLIPKEESSRNELEKMFIKCLGAYKEPEENNGDIPTEEIKTGVTKGLKVQTLQKYIDTIKRYVNYYVKDKNQNEYFMKIINEIYKLCKTETKTKSDATINDVLKSKYNSLATEVFIKVEEIKKSQAGSNVNNVDGQSEGGTTSGGTSSTGGTSGGGTTLGGTTSGGTSSDET